MSNYYLKYESNFKDINKVKNELGDVFDFDFVKRESDYFGEYFIYKGYYSDKIIILHDLEKLKNDDKSNKVIVELFFNEGKSKDKKDKYNYLKEIFRKKLNDYSLKIDVEF